MVDPQKPETEDSAEKAYAAASESVNAKPVPPVAEVAPEPEPKAAEVTPAPIEFPAKAQRARRPRPAPLAKAAAPKAKPGPKAKARKPTARPAPKQAAKPVKPAVSDTSKTPTISQLKDKIMATTTKTPDFTKGFQDAIADFQEKTKAAFEKGTVSLGEVSEFAKGNVEAFVESGKILAAGVQDFGAAYVSESRAAFETLTADVKELASSKTPADFLKLQGELLRRNLDAAVAAGSKNSEAFLKLANEAFAPISGRFSLAVEKIKKAA